MIRCTPARRASLLFLSAAAFACAALAALALSGRPDLNRLYDARLEWATLLMGLALALAIVWWARQRGRLDLFEFPVWFSLNLYGQVVLGFWLFSSDISALYVSLRDAYAHWLFLAILAVSLALCALWAGYVTAFRRLARGDQDAASAPRQFRLARAIGLWLILSPLTILAVPLNLVGWGGVAVGVWSNYLAVVQAIAEAVTVALGLHHFRHPSVPGWVWILAVLALNVLNGVAQGTRGAALAFLNLFMLAYYATGKYRWRWLIAGVFAFLVLAPSATRLRQLVPRYEAVTAATRYGAVSTALSSTLEQSVPELVQEAGNLFRLRQTGLLVTTAAVIQHHPAPRPFVGGQILKDLVAGLVPRVLWPEKPVGHTDLYDITALYTDSGPLVFTAIGLVADSYRAGGWLALAVLFFGGGWCMAWLYRQGPCTCRAEWMLIYIMVLNALTYDTDLSSFLYFSIQRLIPVCALVMLVLYERTRAGRPGRHGG